jgi:probable F420-dependent oxidoreductase
MMLAALRPRMLKLAAERTQGAHPYLVTPEHTARAREILGEGKLLAPEQMLLRERDPSKARAAARLALKPYISAPNYQNSLKEFDFSDDDFQDGGSNRLIDALVAWGDESTIAKRIQEHFDAGADHVAIQALPPDGSAGIDMPLIEALAPA